MQLYPTLQAPYVVPKSVPSEVHYDVPSAQTVHDLENALAVIDQFASQMEAEWASMDKALTSLQLLAASTRAKLLKTALDLNKGYNIETKLILFNSDDDIGAKTEALIEDGIATLPVASETDVSQNALVSINADLSNGHPGNLAEVEGLKKNFHAALGGFNERYKLYGDPDSFALITGALDSDKRTHFEYEYNLVDDPQYGDFVKFEYNGKRAKSVYVSTNTVMAGAMGIKSSKGRHLSDIIRPDAWQITDVYDNRSFNVPVASANDPGELTLVLDIEFPAPRLISFLQVVPYFPKDAPNYTYNVEAVLASGDGYSWVVVNKEEIVVNPQYSPPLAKEPLVTQDRPASMHVNINARYLRLVMRAPRPYRVKKGLAHAAWFEVDWKSGHSSFLGISYGSYRKLKLKRIAGEAEARNIPVGMVRVHNGATLLGSLISLYMSYDEYQKAQESEQQTTTITPTIIGPASPFKPGG